MTKPLRLSSGMSSVAKAVEEVFHLVAPELTLVFHFTLSCKVLDHENGLVRHFRFFDAELEEFFDRGVHPVEPDELFEFAFGYFRLIGCAVPGKAEHIVPFVYFICKPLLQTCRGA